MYTTVNEVREVYTEDGYVILPQWFSHERLERLSRSFRANLPRSGQDGEHTPDEHILSAEALSHDSVYKAAQSVGSSASAYSLLASNDLLEKIADLTGFNVWRMHVLPMYLVVQMPGDVRFDYPWHQDGAYYSWCSEIVTLWFPVNRATDRATGTISVIPGSHCEEDRATTTYLRDGFFRQIESKVDAAEAGKEAVLSMSLGDCCVMDSKLVHRSIANRSASPRVAGIVRIAHIGDNVPYERNRFYCELKS